MLLNPTLPDPSYISKTRTRPKPTQPVDSPSQHFLYILGMYQTWSMWHTWLLCCWHGSHVVNICEPVLYIYSMYQTWPTSHKHGTHVPNSICILQTCLSCCKHFLAKCLQHVRYVWNMACTLQTWNSCIKYYLHIAILFVMLQTFFGKMFPTCQVCMEHGTHIANLSVMTQTCFWQACLEHFISWYHVWCVSDTWHWVCANMILHDSNIPVM